MKAKRQRGRNIELMNMKQRQRWWCNDVMKMHAKVLECQIRFMLMCLRIGRHRWQNLIAITGVSRQFRSDAPIEAMLDRGKYWPMQLRFQISRRIDIHQIQSNPIGIERNDDLISLNRVGASIEHRFTWDASDCADRIHSNRTLGSGLSRAICNSWLNATSSSSSLSLFLILQPCWYGGDILHIDDYIIIFVIDCIDIMIVADWFDLMVVAEPDPSPCPWSCTTLWGKFLGHTLTHTHTHTHTGTHTRGGTHRHDSYRMFPFDIMNFSRPAKKEKEKLEREQKQKVARPVAETHAGRLQLLFHFISFHFVSFRFISFHFVSLALKRAVNKCRRRNRMKEEVETEEMKWENGERKEREKMTMFLAPLLRPPLSSTRHMFVLPVTFVTRFLLLANI